MPRVPLSLSSLSNGGRSSRSGSHHESPTGGSIGGRSSGSGSHHKSPTGGTNSPGISSMNSDGRESGNEQDSDGEGEYLETESVGAVATEGIQNLGLEQPNRMKLTILGKEFEPYYAMSKAVEIVHCHFKGPWIYFSEVPALDRRIWFLEFKKNFWWEESIQEAVMALWKMKVGEHIRTTFYKARKNRKKVSWIAERHWTAMLKRWGDDEKFQRDSTTNKKNRAAESPHGSAGFAGGRKSVIGYIKTYLAINDKEPTMEELMNLTYKKKNGEWSGTRPAIALERFKELVAEAEEKGEEVDVVKLWVKAVGVNRGRVFGLGSRVYDVPPELLEKYSFTKMQKSDLQNDDEFQKYREDMENKVSAMKIEMGAMKEQVNSMKTLVQNMALYLQQPFPSFHGHPSPIQFQAMQSQFCYNPMTVQGSTMAPGDMPTSFTSLLNSNSMINSLDASIPLGPSMGGNNSSD